MFWLLTGLEVDLSGPEDQQDQQALQRVPQLLLSSLYIFLLDNFQRMLVLIVLKDQQFTLIIPARDHDDLTGPEQDQS